MASRIVPSRVYGKLFGGDYLTRRRVAINTFVDLVDFLTWEQQPELSVRHLPLVQGIPVDQATSLFVQGILLALALIPDNIETNLHESSDHCRPS
jgi:hypothetical protein